ncbi:hypothetical protein XA68_15185 [Ophiocordyceps unilateralis]|uniref:FAD/NAD(P)-binding domain-containing protein n=1 Tax=Ophiocordyceps unilateralis TaxID=268505 RepID=A0A2A9PLK0_OPHUN|nr:hypothetical protein XA68_15185 [Ophiocordyceps unilateralis]
MGSVSPSRFHVKQVAIIGAGPSGLAAAKYLLAQQAFDHIAVFEQQQDIGGVWVPPPAESSPPPPPSTVPQTNPFRPPETPVPIAEARPHYKPAVYFPSPVYDHLRANIIGPLMQFSDEPFPSSCCVFPSLEDIRASVRRYGREVRHLVRFGQQVTRLELLQEQGRDRWHLRARDLLSGETADYVFDAVVVASGHYSLPFIPDIKNITDFHRAHPTVVTHSKHYRSPKSFLDKKVIVVGNGPSGIDIAAQINAVSKVKTLLSVKAATSPETLACIGCDEAPEIVEFLIDQRGVRFKDGSVEINVDSVVFCTGYLFSYPFLADLQAKLITNGRGVHGLYKHLFTIQHPTLVFLALPMRSVPWPMSECQAAAVATVWSNQLELPPVEEMLSWSRSLHERVGEALHVMPPGGNCQYINELHDWVMKASHLGKQPPRWSDLSGWQHLHMPEARRRFQEQGCRATTWTELGFQEALG